MRILVTGAVGFIGTNLCLMLEEAGHTAIGVDNFDSYYSIEAKTRNLNSLVNKNIEFRQVDLRRPEETFAAFAELKPDKVVHLAGKAGVRNSVEFPRDYFEANLGGTQNVLEAALWRDIDHVVLASTSSIYGSTKVVPFREDDLTVEPQQPYAASKRSAEILAQVYFRCYGLQSTVTRFFTVYGPRGRPDMMPFKVADSIHNGTQIPIYEGDFERDWTHVNDICAGLILAVEKPLGFEVLNLGRGSPVSLERFIKLSEGFGGGTANLIQTPAPQSEMLRTFADIQKAETMLGFAPSIDLEEGLEDFWAWYRSVHGPRKSLV